MLGWTMKSFHSKRQTGYSLKPFLHCVRLWAAAKVNSHMLNCVLFASRRRASRSSRPPVCWISGYCLRTLCNSAAMHLPCAWPSKKCFLPFYLVSFLQYWSSFSSTLKRQTYVQQVKYFVLFLPMHLSYMYLKHLLDVIMLVQSKPGPSWLSTHQVFSLHYAPWICMQ